MFPYRHVSLFYIPSVNTVYYGIESSPFFAPKIWKLLPKELKNIESLEAFKNKTPSQMIVLVKFVRFISATLVWINC